MQINQKVLAVVILDLEQVRMYWFRKKCFPSVVNFFIVIS